MSEPAPVSFVTCLAGSVHDRVTMLATVDAARRPGDELLVVDGGYGPTLTGDLPDGAVLMRLVDGALSTCFDVAAGRATYDHLIVVGSGCRLSAAAFDRLRAALKGGAPAAMAAGDGGRSGWRPLDERAVLAVERSIWRATGGFAANEDRARRINAGFVGSGDLFEVFALEVRRSGWHVSEVALDGLARGVPLRDSVSVAPTRSTAQASSVGDLMAPSRQVPDELLAAVRPSAAAAVRWFIPILPPGQVESVNRFLDRSVLEHRADRGDGLIATGGAAAAGTWHVLLLACRLQWRGQHLYAAQLLEGADLSGYKDHADINAIVHILASAGRPFPTILEKLGHAEGPLATLIVAQPVDEAAGVLDLWWQLRPGSSAVVEALLTIAPGLSLVQAMSWHARFVGLPLPSPLQVLAVDSRRPSFERAVAARSLMLLAPDSCPAEVEALVTAQPSEVVSAVDQAVEQLLASSGISRAGR